MPMKCSATNRRGQPCQAWAGASGYCFAHDPERTAAHSKASAKGGRKASKLRGLPAAKVRSVSDLLPLLSRLIDDVLVNEYGAVKRARTVAHLARCYANIVMTGELEQRVAAIERALARRSDSK